MSVVQRLDKIQFGNSVFLMMCTVRASVAHLEELNSILSLACIPYWPRQTTGYIRKFFACGWPSQETLRHIVNEGSNVVPISSKAPHFSEAADREWRISFSLAEKTLIHAMNHHQFLCYGLLKMFLNEVIKKTVGIEDLLCSYFLKTAMFWEITESRSAQINCNILVLFGIV